MLTFEFFCYGLAGWALLEGFLILTVPETMQKLTFRLFPRASKPIREISPDRFRLYGLLEVVFGLLLGGYFLFLT